MMNACASMGLEISLQFIHDVGAGGKTCSIDQLNQM